MVLAVAVTLPCAAAETDSATVQFAAADTALSGRTLPLRIDLLNTSASDLNSLYLTTNQFLNYRLDVLVPAGRRGTVSFAPLYFGGAMQLSGMRNADDSQRFLLGGAADEESSDPAADAVSLQPRPLAAETVLLLYDGQSLDTEKLYECLGPWTDYYLAAAGPQSRALLRPQPINVASLQADLLIDSPAAGLVAAASSPQLQELAALARACGLDLWTVGAASRLEHPVVAPPALRELAAGTHIRPDLFDAAVGEQAGYVAPYLFQYRPWSGGVKLRLLLPVIAMGVALLVLALLGGRLKRPVKIVALLVVVAATATWLLVVLGATPTHFVDAVSVVQVDLPTGHTLSEHLAAIYSHRRGSASLHFPGTASGMPRPLMVDDGGRAFYLGTTMHRHSAGQWSVEDIPLRAGSFLAFGAAAWDDMAVSPDSVELSMQFRRPVVRLEGGPSLSDAWLYIDGHAYRLGDIGGDGTYQALGGGLLTDAAAMSDEAPDDLFRRRAMRWIARRHYRADRCVLFGWQGDASAAVEAEAAETTWHGRLLVLLVPRSQVRAD
ncbi:MAG: hypothetical protein JXL80_02260 [Planctomycetes bacterium]|nr:hypothetical protein [Planctomycetota bacterium]